MSFSAFIRPTVLSLTTLLAACGAADDDASDLAYSPAEAHGVLTRLTDFDPAGLDDCTDAELSDLAGLAECMKTVRDDLCAANGITPADCDSNVLAVPDAGERCAVPAAPSEACAAALAGDADPEPPANNALNCGTEQDMSNVAVGAYFDSTLANLYGRAIPKTRWMTDGDAIPGTLDTGVQHSGTARLMEWVFDPFNWRFGYQYDVVATDSEGGDAPWAWAHLMDEYDTILDDCN